MAKAKSNKSKTRTSNVSKPNIEPNANKPNTTMRVAAVVIIISLSVFFFGYLVGERMSPVKVVKQIEYRTEYKPVNITREVKIEVPQTENEVFMRVPAVDRQGNGVLGNLSVITRKGEGLILVSINNVLADFDTQLSARTAAQFASQFTNTKINDMDIIYKISAEAPLISGTSAGGAMAIATIAALQNRKLTDKVIMTGTINPDGSIGPVGGILAKAEAAKQHGIVKFLVPPGQSKGVSYKEEKKCWDRMNTRYCTITYAPENLNISEEVGIDVVEVSSVKEAVKYFLD